MPIELIRLSDETFAGVSHATAASWVLGDAGVDVEATDGSFDTRFLGLARDEISALVRGGGGALVDSDGTVVLQVGSSSARQTTVTRPLDADPVARGLAERAVVDLLLARLVDVVLHDPHTIWIESSVRVAAGAELWGGVVLRGSTTIGAASIGSGAVLTDTRVDDGAVVLPYCVCTDARIGPDAKVGPMAHLRPRADLRRASKVGNFVEVKNTVLDEGAKASHLTYLGDAAVGPGANIGAGTITCNYDGFNKWRTEIGAGAFIGSNSSLVAPVSIAAGAIVAAGTTLTQNVPEDALALARPPQKVLAGMGARLMAKNRKIKEDSRG